MPWQKPDTEPSMTFASGHSSRMIGMATRAMAK